MTEETIFSRIIQGEVPCDKIYSDDKCIAFRDIEPIAPVHILLIPKKGIVNLKDVVDEDKDLLGHLIFVSSKIAKQENLESWRIVINNGSEAGQTVFHLHIHIIGGRQLNWPPG